MHFRANFTDRLADSWQTFPGPPARPMRLGAARRCLVSGGMLQTSGGLFPAPAQLGLRSRELSSGEMVIAEWSVQR